MVDLFGLFFCSFKPFLKRFGSFTKISANSKFLQNRLLIYLFVFMKVEFRICKLFQQFLVKFSQKLV